MSSTEAAVLEDELRTLECYFTWELEKEKIDLTYLLNRLEEHADFKRGGNEGLARTYNSLGFVKYLLGSHEEALAFVQKCVELTREYRDNDCDRWLIVPYGNLAWLQYHMKCFSECESYLEKIRSIAQKFPDSALGLHHEVLGEKAWVFFRFSRKYYNQAKECFERALELEPENAQWNRGYALVLHRMETPCSSEPSLSTIKQLRRALETDSDNDELKAILAVKLAQSMEYDEGEKLMEEALEGSPNAPNVIRYVGKFLRDYGSVEMSIALLKRALEKTPTSAFINHQLALSYKRKKKDLQIEARQNSTRAADEIQRLRSQCIYHLDKATELKCGFIIAMNELAVQYSEDGKVDRAEELFQQTMQIAKEKDEHYQYVHLRYAEFQQYFLKCESAAIKHYTECLKMNPNRYEGKKSAERLERIAQKRIENNPKDGEAFGILGLVHKEKGKKQQAIECFEKALSFVDNEDYLSHLCELTLSLQ